MNTPEFHLINPQDGDLLALQDNFVVNKRPGSIVVTPDRDTVYSSEPPSNPYPGQKFFDTTDGTYYYWDHIRSLWLSLHTVDLLGGNASSATTMYARYGNVAASSTNGWEALHNYVVVEANFSNTVSITADMQIRGSGANLGVAASCAAVTRGSGTGLNIAISQGQLVSTYLTCSVGTAANWISWACLRRKYT